MQQGAAGGGVSGSAAGDGLGTGPDLLAAVPGAVRAALAPLGGVAPDLVALFVCGVDARTADAVAALVTDLAGARVVVGCTAPGVLAGGREVRGEPAVAVWAARLPGARLRAHHLEVLPAAEGRAVVGLPVREPDDRALLLLADPVAFPASGFLDRLDASAPGLPVVGGLAGPPEGGESVRLFLDGRSVDRGAVGVLIGGPVPVTPVVSQGCRPVGVPMTVTRSAGTVLLELAGTRAAVKLRDVLATLGPEDRAVAESGVVLGVAMDEYADAHDHGDFLARGIVGVDADRQGLVVGDVLGVGRTVQFLVRDAAAADAELRLLAARLRRDAAPVGALLVSSASRGTALFGGGADHDARAVRESLGPGAGVAGFASGGELGPVGGRSHLHGLTACLLAVGRP